MRQLPYSTALRGLGSEFSQINQPQEFALRLTNRFINLLGDAERRPGLEKITSPADNGFTGKFIMPVPEPEVIDD